MENKKTYLTKTLCLTVVLLLLSSILLIGIGNTASAATDELQDQEVETRGIYTKISIDIGASGNTMIAEAHNDFTLGPSTIKVYVYLFSSLTYTEDCSQMTLESQNYIGDLNINQSLRTTAEINGVQRYWRARVEFKLDNKDWTSQDTRTYLVDVNGNVVQ